jgi:hypothetical protein
MIPQNAHIRAMIRQVQPKPTLSGKLARRMGQTTDPTDDPVLITPLFRQIHARLRIDERTHKARPRRR